MIYLRWVSPLIQLNGPIINLSLLVFVFYQIKSVIIIRFHPNRKIKVICKSLLKKKHGASCFTSGFYIFYNLCVPRFGSSRFLCVFVMVEER